ncbi:MAG TPA: hypothetical protein VF339_10425 [Gammaproteobacteria bacterium]
MWRAIIAIAAVALIVSPKGVSQESLCDPCVDPPRPTRHDSASPSETSVGTSEDLNRLGGTSIDAVLRQLPKFFAEETEPDDKDGEPADSAEPAGEADSEVPDE